MNLYQEARADIEGEIADLAARIAAEPVGTDYLGRLQANLVSARSRLMAAQAAIDVMGTDAS